MLEFYSSRKLWGIPRVYRETLTFDTIVRRVFDETKELEHFDKPIAIFAYGSPGRYEFTGGDSDADIFIAEPSKSDAGELFTGKLKKRWQSFDFSKVDVPPWSTYEEIDTFLQTSLVEGNQVLETRFICGDGRVKQDIEEKKKRFYSSHRELVNIVFNKLYFDQYFQQRVRNGAKNIKYCSGGTRDFLIFYWYDRLCREFHGEDTSLSEPTQPKIKEGLERLMMNGLISGQQFGKTLEAVNGLIELRTDALMVNRGTEERGLSVFDDSLIERLQRNFGYPEKETIKTFFDNTTDSIGEVVKVVWKNTLKIGSVFYGKDWGTNLELARSVNTPQNLRLKIPDYDISTKVALLWGATNSGDLEVFNILLERYHKIMDWGVIASIACSPLCNPDVLHEIGTGIAKEKGYGYLLRIVGRNKNARTKTLKSIAEDPQLDKRYSEVARTALEAGNIGANNLI